MELKFGIWNIRGMGTSDKQKEVLNLIQSENYREHVIGCLVGGSGIQICSFALKDVELS